MASSDARTTKRQCNPSAPDRRRPPYERKGPVITGLADSRPSRREFAMQAIKSLEDEEGLRCVDIIEREDGTYTFKEFRKDREDAGRWLLVRDFSSITCTGLDETIRAAATRVPWLAEVQ
jgi:hypothetical protein